MSNASIINEYKDKIKLAKDFIEKTEREILVAETEYKHIEEEEEKLLEELKELGCDPDDLENIISEKEKELGTLIDTLENDLNLINNPSSEYTIDETNAPF